MTDPRAPDGGPVVTFKSPGPIIAHEAAHAAVMVRLELPLRVVSIEGALRDDGLYHGGAVVDEGASHHWQDDPTSPEAVAAWENMAAVFMAGVESDLKHGMPEGAPGHRHDLDLAATCAAFLGIVRGARRYDPFDFDLMAFMRTAAVVAAREMGRDGGAAWEVVSNKLAQTLKLTGDEVRELVRLSDEARRTG